MYVLCFRIWDALLFTFLAAEGRGALTHLAKLTHAGVVADRVNSAGGKLPSAVQGHIAPASIDKSRAAPAQRKKVKQPASRSDAVMEQGSLEHREFQCDVCSEHCDGSSSVVLCAVPLVCGLCGSQP